MQSFEQPHIVSFDHLEGSVAVAHTAFDHGALRRTNREVYQSCHPYRLAQGRRKKELLRLGTAARVSTNRSRAQIEKCTSFVLFSLCSLCS